MHRAAVVISYEVTVEVAPAQAAAYIVYMRDRHIPDLMATGCFITAELEQDGPARFRQRYRPRDQAALDRYLAEHAPAFRLDFQQHFPERISISRAVWHGLGRWDAPAGR